MSILITAYRKRTCSFTVTVNDANGDVVVFSGDVMRIKIGRKGSTPILDLDSVAASANGSTVSAANPTTVRLDQDDLDITPGILDFEGGIVDDQDSDAFKHAEDGVIAIHETMTGDIGTA